jgi:hypothetical protein
MGSRSREKFYKDPFVGIPREILNSPSWIALDFSARALYIEIRLRMNGFNNGNINATISELRHKGFNSPATIAKGLRQLEATKLIAKTRATVGVEYGSKICNLYCLTDIDVLEAKNKSIKASKASHGYRAITSVKEAKKIVAAASPSQKKRLQNLKRYATKLETYGDEHATENVSCTQNRTSKNAAPHENNKEKNL